MSLSKGTVAIFGRSALAMAGVASLSFFAACNAVGTIGPTPPGAADAGSTGGVDGGGSTGPLPSPEACTTPQPGRRLLRRLTRGEYDRTVHDLLGVPSDFGAHFAADAVVAGFDDHADALVVSDLLADQLRLAAEDLSLRAVEHLEALVPCSVPPANATACATDFIRSFGERAFRRPVTQADVTRYLAIYQLGAEDEGFSGGVRWVIAAMLQSPSFLYRPELGTSASSSTGASMVDYRLSPWEVASFLSYAITGTMPDAALFELARSGDLARPEVVEREARRLFRSPAGRANVGRFVAAWLGVDRLPDLPKDATTFPELTPAIRAKMLAETEKLVEHVVFEGTGTLGELLTSDQTFVDADLAAYYGISPPTTAEADGFGRVSVRTAAGLLTQGSVLTTHARATSSSPVHRGKLVRERLLCQPLPPPPPGIAVQPPPLDPNLTTRERYRAHSSVDPCRGCHQAMDPIGFAFEHFDGIGRWRDDENGHAIDATGAITGSLATNGTFDGTAELARLLAGSTEVSDCFAEEWARFAYGVAPRAELACVTASVAAVLRAPNATVEDLVVAIATSLHVTTRTGPPPPEGQPEDPPPVEEPPMMPPEPPATTPALVVDVHLDSEWPTGSCSTVTVTNGGTETVTWTATVRVDGTLTQHWNSEVMGESGDVVFSGASWNATLVGGGSTSFGFCAAR